MKFFIPAAQGNEQTESVYNSIKLFAKQNTGWKIQDTRIYSIRYRHNGKEYFAAVGAYETFTNDLVLAIFKSNAYLVCTKNRGGIKGEPILVGDKELIDIEYFEN